MNRTQPREDLMQLGNGVVLVTLLAILLYLWTSVGVARARVRHKIIAPAVTGHPEFERAYRVQMNTLEWLPLFLPSLWLFAFYWNDGVAVAVGAVWIVGRIMYAISYVKDPSGRATGFAIQSLATAVLLFGTLGKALLLAVTQGI
jgi:glutathione S-transferase